MPGNVVELSANNAEIDAAEAARRRLAIQLASQLPEDALEARKVVGLILILVDHFLAAPTPF